MKNESGVLTEIDYLVKINQANNQAFFLKGFSHMCKTPINSVQLGCELLQNYVYEIERVFTVLESEPEQLPFITGKIRKDVLSTMPKIIQSVITSAQRLNRFVSQMSEFSAGGSMAGRYDVDINHLASLCISMSDHQIRAFTDHFHLDLDSNIPIMTGNAQQMLQVILNLLMNSLLSLPDRTRKVVLSTSCNRETGRIQICIRDTGTGISPDILPRIIEPFFTTWRKLGCMGLGLTVADRFIRNHGGELSIESVPGEGTTALVSLPLGKWTAVCTGERNHD